MSAKNTHGKGGSAVSASKESLSFAYVSALLAKLSLNHNKPETDDQSIDVTVYGRKFDGAWKEPQLQLQLKCTSRKDCFDKNSNEIIIDLTNKNYEDLRAASPIPKVLVVHHAPDEQSDWVKENTHSIELMNMSYWYILRDLPKVDGKKRIRIPLAQRLDSQNLLKMLEDTSHFRPINNLELNNVK